MVVVAFAAGASGCSSSSSASSLTSQTGCEVSFSNIQNAGQDLPTSALHDGSPTVVGWSQSLGYLDVLGAEVVNTPVARAFEVTIKGTPFVEGATFPLGLRADGAQSRVDLEIGKAGMLTTRNGDVQIGAATASRVVFTVAAADMVAIDPEGNVKDGGPSLTMTMRCAIDAPAK